MAVLHIPKLNLEVPVFDGTDELTLNRGAGRIIGTARLGEVGNVGIAAHRDGFFRGLQDVGAGDTIELKLPDRTERYRVTGIQITTPENVSVLQPTVKASLTLVTCYPFYFVGSAPQRYIVHAAIPEQMNLMTTSSQRPIDKEKKEKAMKPTTVKALFFASAVWITAAMTLMAQERSTTSVTPGTSSATTQVERAEVTYVSGNELVVKMDTGEVRYITVPDSARATVDGKEVTIRDLKPGMKLQRTITTTQTPKTVTTVRTVTGKVFAVTAPLHVILSFPDGSPNKQYKVPKDQRYS